MVWREDSEVTAPYNKPKPQTRGLRYHVTCTGLDQARDTCS